MLRFLLEGSSWLAKTRTYSLAFLLPLLALPSSLRFVQERPPQLGSVERFKPYKTAQLEPIEKDKQEGDSSEPRVLINEVVIEGLDDHPDKERLEFAAYDAMSVRPGSSVNKAELKRQLDLIYSTGWFSGVRLEPVDSLLGVQLLVEVQPNPVLKKVEISPVDSKLPSSLIEKVFSRDYGKTLNLNVLQLRMKELKSWYTKEGYSLARIAGPNRVTAQGIVQLKVIEGTVSSVDIKFLNTEGESVDEKGNKIRGKTREWVIKREISMKPGDIFNRNRLEKDLKRLYSTSLFSDIKVTLNPIPGEPGKVTILLGITEQSTGSLTGGVGYSGAQGGFGQIGLQESNFLGRAWNAGLNFTYGQYGGLVNFSFFDPWIRGDKYRTSFRTSIFISREVPQEFRSQTGGSIRSVADYYDAGSPHAYDIGASSHGQGGPFSSVEEAKSANSNVSWFDYEGDSVSLQRTGVNFSFARPLNGGDPYKESSWSVLLGMNIQQVKAIDYAGNSRPYGVSVDSLVNSGTQNDHVICVAFNCAKENNLFGLRTAATYSTLNDARNPRSGNFLSVGSEQFLGLGENSPTFNRAKASYSYFIPVNFLKLTKGCRPKPGEKENCPQAIGLQVKAGTIVGQLPPYEAFCLGGSSSVRGWNSCDLGVGRSFGEASVEYRFPIWRLLSGAFFVDGATDMGSQAKVPGNPGKLLGKDGSGFSLGSGLIVNTPVGPLRLEAASKDMSGDWRFNLGVGWKF